MAKVISFQQVNPCAAAIDIGSEKVFVSTDGITVRSYATFTQDYHQLVADLRAAGIQRVCMEATGVYWVALYELLETAGMEVCLVNPKEVKQVKGRKSDPGDCRWIQKVFSAGLLRQSYVPAGLLREVRLLVRERNDIIEMGSAYVNKMSKCLELMNIKLTGVLAQIQGGSGLRIIEAIIAGQRDAHELLLLCDRRIINTKAAEVLKALQGTYNDTVIFLLQTNLHLWKLHQQQLHSVDQKLEALLDVLQQGKVEVVATAPVKAMRHHAPKIRELHQKLLNIYGVDCSTISGINDYTLLKLLAEVGSEVSRFPTAAHFASWCGLAPVLNQSGKMNRRIKTRNGSAAGQIFRQVAQGLLNSKHIAIGSFMRKIRARKDSKIAVKAGARKLAVAFYNLLTKGKEYVEQGVARYEQQLKEKEQAYLRNMAKKHGFQLVLA